MVQSHSALGERFWDTRQMLTRARGGPRELGCAGRGPGGACHLLSLRSAACTEGPGANSCSWSTGAATGAHGQGAEQRWQVKGNGV